MRLTRTTSAVKNSPITLVQQSRATKPITRRPRRILGTEAAGPSHARCPSVRAEERDLLFQYPHFRDVLTSPTLRITPNKMPQGLRMQLRAFCCWNPPECIVRISDSDPEA